jgi:hypothetical protein
MSRWLDTGFRLTPVSDHLLIHLTIEFCRMKVWRTCASWDLTFLQGWSRLNCSPWSLLGPRGFCTLCIVVLFFSFFEPLCFSLHMPCCSSYLLAYAFMLRIYIWLNALSLLGGLATSHASLCLATICFRASLVLLACLCMTHVNFVLWLACS